MGADYGSSQIRNVVLMGHGGSGKTTLVDAMCFVAGSVNRRGTVEGGTAHTDFTQEEVDHGISINLAVARLEWMGTKLNLLDTPGYMDFFGEVEAAARVCDGAVAVVSATTGVEVGTERVWDVAARREMPRLLFVTMMDRENADFEKTFAQIRERFGAGAIPVEVPIGDGENFRGIVNLFSDRAHVYRADSDRGEYDETDVPAEMADAVASYRESLIESIAATDDELLEAYLEGEKLDREKILAAMKAAMARGELFPVFCGAGSSGRGVRALLNKIVELLPSPADRPAEVATDGSGADVELPPTDDAPFTALVFKTTQEPRVGELSFFRVFSGSPQSGSTVYNPVRQSSERISHLGVPDGTTRDEVPQLHAGDIGVVAKLKDTHTGDTLCAEGDELQLGAIEWPSADISIALRP
ncbi:MAG: GTP-binding protein, partial [Acidobacteriota bacterium]